MTVRIMFVDRSPEEVLELWRLAMPDGGFHLLPFEPFVSVQRTLDLLHKERPHLLVVDFRLGPSQTGADVLSVLDRLSERPFTVANSRRGPAPFFQAGTDPDFIVDRNPARLRQVMHVAGILIESGRHGGQPAWFAQAI
jgi:hypothetical protein